jgi:hypothetical protein
MHVDEHREGVMIAPLCSFDDGSLVHGRLSFGTPWAVVLDSIWRRVSAKGSS